MKKFIGRVVIFIVNKRREGKVSLFILRNLVSILSETEYEVVPGKQTIRENKLNQIL